MSDIIYPRSPRETMDGWPHLPRYLDKVRLHLAGKLHPDYQQNYGSRGFDKSWLDAAGVTHAQMVEVVKRSITDGEVCDWVKHHVKKSPADKAALLASMLNYPIPMMLRGLPGFRCVKSRRIWPIATTSRTSSISLTRTRSDSEVKRRIDQIRDSF
jgi:hypothetical protein